MFSPHYQITISFQILSPILSLCEHENLNVIIILKDFHINYSTLDMNYALNIC